MRTHFHSRIIGLAVLCFLQTAKVGILSGNETPILPNGGFETAGERSDWPDFWEPPKSGVTWETEAGNRFVKLQSPSPGELVTLHRALPVPPGAQALELTWKQRVTGLKIGRKPWFDVRMVVQFEDAEGRLIEKQPKHPSASKDTRGWVNRRTAFLVPEKAAKLVVMPTLFYPAAGILEVDDLAVNLADPAPLLAQEKIDEEVAREHHVPAEEPKREKWPSELRVQGNRLIDAKGKEVWLQGLNAGGLETLPNDLQPVKSAVVAVEDWKANIVRLPVKGSFWFGGSAYQADGGEAYRQTVDHIINLVANRGAYVALDLHHFRAPREEDARFWKEAAARYKDHPAVLFDLFNEPHGTSWEVWRNGGFVGDENAAAVDETAFLSDQEKAKNRGFQSVGMQGLIDAARGTGAQNIVIVGGLDWAYDLTGIAEGHTLDDRGGNGLMLATHVYPWKSDWAKKFLHLAEHYPIFVGEVGADVKKMDFLPPERQEDPYTWVPDMLGLIQDYRLHWAGWCFHPSATPIMISDWKYTPTPFWGQPAKDALAGKKFQTQKMR